MGRERIILERIKKAGVGLGTKKCKNMYVVKYRRLGGRVVICSGGASHSGTPLASKWGQRAKGHRGESEGNGDVMGEI